MFRNIICYLRQFRLGSYKRLKPRLYIKSNTEVLKYHICKSYFNISIGNIVFKTETFKKCYERGLQNNFYYFKASENRIEAKILRKIKQFDKTNLLSLE